MKVKTLRDYLTGLPEEFDDFFDRVGKDIEAQLK
jgi:hypothetical protein